MFFRLTINETPIICTQVNYMDTHACNPSVMKTPTFKPWWIIWTPTLIHKLLTETPMFFQNQSYEQIYEDTHVCSLKYNPEHPPYSDKHKDGSLDKRMSK